MSGGLFGGKGASGGGSPPYSDEDIAGASRELAGKTEQDALIAYLQVLGTSLKAKQ